MLQSHAEFARSSATAAGSRSAISERWLPAAVTVCLALLFVSLNPVGYIGGGYDDWQYLEAARCIAERGYCTPDSHWAARFPLVLPTGLILALLGEARSTLWVVPLVYGSAALLLFVGIVRRAYGSLEALIAGATLALTPVVGGAMLALNVALPELFFIVAAAYAAQTALLTGHARWAAASGALLSLAILTRGTAVALLPLAALGFCFMPRRVERRLFCLGAGLAAVLAAEMIVSSVATGDPLHSWRLAFGHTQVASAELSRAAAASGSPLFNTRIIAGWSRDMGIEVHWSLDGALNLLADPGIGFTLLAGLSLLILAACSGQAAALKGPLLLLGAASFYFGALTYALAVDPKSRMFLPVVAASAAIVGIVGGALWRDGRRSLILLVLGLLLLNGAARVPASIDFFEIEDAAARWASEAPAETAIDETARRVLTLRPEVRRLTTLPAPGARRLLTLGSWPCPDLGRPWRLARYREFAPIDTLWLPALRSSGLAGGGVEPIRLCEFRRG